MASNSSKPSEKDMEDVYGSSWQETLTAAKKSNAKILDLIVTDELNRQPQLRNLLSPPSLLNEPWKATSVVEGWQIPEMMVPNAYLRKALIYDYREIRLHPYLPKAWNRRSATLLVLGYAELAVADAHKARLLIQELNSTIWANIVQEDSLAIRVFKAMALDLGFKSNDELVILDNQLHLQMKSGYKQATLLMVQGLNYLAAYSDVVWILKGYLQGIPDEPSFTILLKEAQDKLQERKRELQERLQDDSASEIAAKRGQVHRVAYPWIATSAIIRGSAATKRLKAKFKDASSNAAIAASPLGCSPEDSLGVFATQKIRKGEPILSSRSIFTARNMAPGGNCGHNGCGNNYCAADHCAACCQALFAKGIPAACCKSSFCSEDCKADALGAYHKVLCGKDFSEIYQLCGGVDAEKDGVVLVMIKVLAAAVQQNLDPLKVPCVAALKADYESKDPAPFSLHDNILYPVQILQQFSIDVFSTPRFDAWVLQTLFLRIANNRRSDTFGKTLEIGCDPLLGMFNHDCDPAAACVTAQGFGVGGAVDVVALREIGEGEEICVSYALVELSEVERREAVAGRIGRRCGCKRCVRERGVEEKEVELRVLGALMEAMLGL